MEIIKIPKKYKQNIFDRFNIKKFQKDGYSHYTNETDCLLCRDFFYPSPTTDTFCQECSLKKYEFNGHHGCIIIMHEWLNEKEFFSIYQKTLRFFKGDKKK